MSTCLFCFDPSTGDCHGDAALLTWPRRKQFAKSILAMWPEEQRKKSGYWPKVRALVMMLDKNQLVHEIAATQAELPAEEFSAPQVDDFAPETAEQFGTVPA